MGCLCGMPVTLLRLWQRHKFIEALLDYVVPTAPQQLNPFWVFGSHFHQHLHLPVHVFEETEAAVSAGRGEVGVIERLARPEIVHLAAFPARNSPFWKNVLGSTTFSSPLTELPFSHLVLIG